jgi:hypothetical protein
MLAVEAKVAGWLIWSGGRLVLGIVLSLVQSRLEGKRHPRHPAVVARHAARPLRAGSDADQGWLGGLLQMVLLGSAFAHLMLLRAAACKPSICCCPWRAVSAILSLIWLAVLVGWQGSSAGLDPLIPG